jgi:hypothetical protein
MGEYANYQGNRIKIGTCEDMLYLRYEDRHLMQWQHGNLDAANTTGLRWRLPFPDEDGCGPGSYTDPFRGIRLWKGNEWFRSPALAENPGTIQMVHDCGYMANVPCYHGEKLPTVEAPGVTIHWNGKAGGFYDLVQVKNTVDGVLPVIRCRFCHDAWRSTWAEVLEWIPDPVLRARLEKHAEPVAL